MNFRELAVRAAVLGVVMAAVGCQAPVTPSRGDFGVPTRPSEARNPERPRDRSVDRPRDPGEENAGGYESRRSRGERGGRRGGPRAQTDSQPGTFDYYLLTLSWSPEFCLKKPQAAECASHPGFILHGLWPENVDGTFPEHCSNAPGPTGNFTDIFADQGLMQHEWQTHGTCTGLDANTYFGDARQALHGVRIPAELASARTPGMLSPQQIVGDFVTANPGLTAADVVLSCGNNRLTAVEVCLGKDLKPVSCKGVHSCGANVVKITPPGASLQ